MNQNTLREDAKQLRYYAASLTYNDTTAEGEAKHRLHEIAMRIETGYYAKLSQPAQADAQSGEPEQAWENSACQACGADATRYVPGPRPHSGP